MKKTLALLTLGTMLLGIGTLAVSAATMHETIHLQAASMAGLSKVTGAARVTYTKHDVAIHVTTDNLPKPSTIHASKYYAVWLKSGSKFWFVGDLKLNGAMGGVSKMLMLQKFQDVDVTAEKSMHPMHAMGTIVLSGMSSHH
jgi:hypothetical protein